MQAELRRAFTEEIRLADVAEAENDAGRAFRHLERAHILGQRYLITHLTTHWRMLRLARRRSDNVEARGQVVRLLAVFPGYAFGWIPKGNTGGANVSATVTMAPPPDLAPLLADYNVWRDVAMRAAIWGALAFAVFAAMR